MALKIRLRQMGRNNRACYRVVLTDVHAPRDGKYLENLGWYDPLANEHDNNLSLNSERIQFWLNQGAQISEKVENLLGRAAPAVLRWYKDKEIKHRAHMAAKRKARKAAQAA
jgi:small subunit ribosomal protein S16